jgi:C-terminal processing protease CtpA/Prc
VSGGCWTIPKRMFYSTIDSNITRFMNTIRLISIVKCLILLFLISSCCRSYLPEKAQNKLYQVKKYMYDYHPNPNYFVPYSFTDSVFDHLNRRINQSKKLSNKELQAIIESYIASFNDGHTSIYPPLFEEITNLAFGRCFPFDVSVNGMNMTTERAYLHKVATTCEAEIITINDVPTEILLTEIKDRIPANNHILKDRILSSSFPYWLWRYGSIKPPFKIELVTSSNDTILIEKSSLKYSKYTHLSTNAWKCTYEEMFSDTSGSFIKPVAWEIEKRKKGLPNYYLYLTDSIAILRIRKFSGSADQRQFYEECFQEISKQINIKSLFIDLRGNRGGRTRNFEALFSFLSADTIIQAKEVLFKVNNETLHYAQKMKKHGYPLLYDKIKGHKPGELVHLFEEKDLMIINDNNNFLFDGEVYVLVDEGTFSAAVGFATIVRNNELGYIIGAPTGGMTNSFGDPVKLKLKGTRLSLLIPTKHILMDDLSIKNPLIPHYIISFDEYGVLQVYNYKKLATNIIDYMSVGKDK